MIYVVEDNDGIRETIKAYLQLANFSVLEFEGVSGVIEALPFKPPRLCILDVMLPDGNGFALARRIRAERPEVPFLFLTAREAESDRITGLELGAEDYIVKPFSPRELVLRVQIALRRAGDTSPKEHVRHWSFDGHRMQIDEQTHTVQVDGKIVHLTAVEWKILTFLASQAGRLVSRDRILGECLDYFHEGSERTVNTHLKNLRAKLGGGGWLETVRGFGYKFVAKAGDDA